MTMEITLENIAKKHFRTPTLKLRNRDRLDFVDVSVSQIRRALEDAYKAGASGKPKLRKNLRHMVKASNELISTIQAARENWDTGALDEIEPATNDLLQKTCAAEDALKGASS